ncbi:MAG: hypothetical protein HYY03_01495, partial [Chloroflexi bacterium]|nr:hypothetical protein [Chloroflexota bacterium]
NFIGYPSSQARDVPDVLAGVSYNSVWAYDPTLSPSPWQSYDPDVPPFLNTLEQFEAGRGYALNAPANGMLTITNSGATGAGGASRLGWLLPVAFLGLSVSGGLVALGRRAAGADRS